MVIRKSFFTHDVNIDVPFITALGVAYDHLREMRKSVFRSLIQEELYVPVEMCYLVNTRFLSPWVDHRKVNAVSPGITMLSEVLFVTKDG